MSLSKRVEELNIVKSDLKALKTSEKELTNQIKEELQEQGLETKILKDINMKVTCKQAVKTEINEDALIKIITNLIDEAEDDLKDELLKCLVVKTVIDEDKVVELIYKGFISVQDIQPALIEKSYTRLTIKEVK